MISLPPMVIRSEDGESFDHQWNPHPPRSQARLEPPSGSRVRLPPHRNPKRKVPKGDTLNTLPILDPTFFRCSSAKIQGWPKTPLAVPLCSETPINHGMWTDQGNKTGFVNWQPPKRYFWGIHKNHLKLLKQMPVPLDRVYPIERACKVWCICVS